CGYRSARNSHSRACNTRSGNNNRYHTRLRMDPPHIRPEKLRRRLRRTARAKAFVCGALLQSLLLFSSDDSLSLSSEFPFFFRDRRFASAESELRRIRTILIQSVSAFTTTPVGTSRCPDAACSYNKSHYRNRAVSLIRSWGARSGAWVSQLVGLADLLLVGVHLVA